MTATTKRTDYDNIPEWTLTDCRQWFEHYGWGLVTSSAEEYRQEYDDDDYTGYLQACIEDIVGYFGTGTYASGEVDRP